MMALMEVLIVSFEFFDRQTGIMIVVPGEYEVFYGNSSDPKDLKTLKIMISK
jgi:beta-glucosidase